MAKDVRRHRPVRAQEPTPSSQGATFVANPDYWGGKPNLDGTAFTFYTSQEPQITALQGGQVDVIVQFVAQGAQAITNGGTYDVIKLKSSSHRELSMRCDQSPFSDRQVRQAVALAFNRPEMVSALLQGLGQVGNDSPFAPKFPSTNTSVPQRSREHGQGQGAAQGRRPPERVLGHPLHGAVPGDPGSSRR